MLGDEKMDSSRGGVVGLVVGVAAEDLGDRADWLAKCRGGSGRFGRRTVMF